MLRGQNTLSPTIAMTAGINVSAASMASTMPTARHTAMVETSENVHRAITANPMITAIPDVKTDSPAHFTASVMAASFSRPFLRSSLYLDIMKME